MFQITDDLKYSSFLDIFFFSLAIFLIYEGLLIKILIKNVEYFFTYFIFLLLDSFQFILVLIY